MIRVQGLRKEFGDVVAVDGVSFEAARGEVFGLLGENGAGKTTTLRMLATLLRPTAGTALIDGVDVTADSGRVRRMLGIVFAGGLYERLTARENIRYFGRLNGLRGADLERRIDDLLARLGMERYADVRAGKFSTGMRQRVVIARALVHDPPVILMDEPTSGLDISATRVVHDFVLQAKTTGKCIIFSSHNMNEVEKLCDRVAVMNRGRIVASDTIAGMLKSFGYDNFEDLFVQLVGNDPMAKRGMMNEQ